MFVGINLGINRGTGLRSSAAFSPSTLFASSEPGVWYDPSDVANLAWRRNQLTYTEQFDNNAAWTKTSATLTAGVTDPSGGTAATTLTATAANGQAVQSITGSLGTSTTYTGSIWVRRRTGTGSVYLFNPNSGGITEIIITGTWQRYSVVGLGAALNNAFGVRVTTSGDAVDIAFPQFEAGSTASAYQRITDVNAEVIERFPTATLFQDTAGTTPVTTPGQTVALMLDKSKGLVLGSELVVNGDFSSGTTGWSLTGDVTVVDSRLRMFNPSGIRPVITQSFPTVVGRSYKVTFSFEVIFGGVVNCRILRADSSTDIIAPNTGVGIFTALDTTTVFYMRSNNTTVGSGLVIDNISVKELPGFHATQATAASQPTYGIVPLGGRRNLLTRTEEFDNAAWVKTGCTVTAQGGGVWRLQASAGAWTLAQNVPINAVNHVMSVEVKSNGAGLDNALVLFSGVRSASFTATNEWQKVSVTGLHNNNAGANGIWNNGSAPVDILIRFPQFELGSTASAYQRVGTAFDVTESGVQSLSYLYFDGVARFMVTPTITPGIDKVTVGTGVRKLSDPADAIVVELGTGSQNGSFYLGAPVNVAAWRYSLQSRGTIGVNANVTAAGFAAPVTTVVSGLADISGDVATIRANGVQQAQVTTDQGTGNFLAYPLYIGRRGGTTLPLNGQVYSLVVRFASTDLATVGQLESWINGKTGAYS